MVGEPRNELDRASGGNSHYAGLDYLHRMVRAVRFEIAGARHDIGGATNCANPGLSANCANQRSRWTSRGLLMPSTPNQRLA
jgi:hypothetical protein